MISNKVVIYTDGACFNNPGPGVMLVSFVQETLLRNSPAVTGKPPPTEWNYWQ